MKIQLYISACFALVCLAGCSGAMPWTVTDSDLSGKVRERFLPKDSLSEGKTYFFADRKFSRIEPVGDYFAIKSIRSDIMLPVNYIYQMKNGKFLSTQIAAPHNLVCEFSDKDKSAIAEKYSINPSALDNLTEIRLALTGVDETRALYEFSYELEAVKGLSKALKFYAVIDINEINNPCKKIQKQYIILSGEKKE
jgi:hypothetical protein